MYASDFTGIRITVRREYYARTTGGSWQRKPYNVTTGEFTPDEYVRTVSSRYPGDRFQYGYTYAGYIPVKVTKVETYSHNFKCVHSFCFSLVA